MAVLAPSALGAPTPHQGHSLACIHSKVLDELRERHQGAHLTEHLTHTVCLEAVSEQAEICTKLHALLLRPPGAACCTTHSQVTPHEYHARHTC